jgi:hypothetical protein
LGGKNEDFFVNINDKGKNEAPPPAKKNEINEHGFFMNAGSRGPHHFRGVGNA